MSDYKTIDRKYGKICNSNIGSGGDCWGDSYCITDNYPAIKSCEHKDLVCQKCKTKFCGCCYFWRWKKCPACEVQIKN